MARARARSNVYAAMPFLACIIMGVGCFFTIQRLMEYTNKEVEPTVDLPPLPKAEEPAAETKAGAGPDTTPMPDAELAPEAAPEAAPPAEEGKLAPPAEKEGAVVPHADEGESAPPAEEGGAVAPPAEEKGAVAPPAEKGGAVAPAEKEGVAPLPADLDAAEPEP